MLWIKEVKDISFDDGLKNSGGVAPYLFGLDLFYDTIDENSKVINNAYAEGNIRLFTIKVHALKSSARIIGALKLAELSEKNKASSVYGACFFMQSDKKQ